MNCDSIEAPAKVLKYRYNGLPQSQDDRLHYVVIESRLTLILG